MYSSVLVMHLLAPFAVLQMPPPGIHAREGLSTVRAVTAVCRLLVIPTLHVPGQISGILADKRALRTRKAFNAFTTR